MSDNAHRQTLDLWFQEKYYDSSSLGMRVTRTLHSSQSEFQRLDIFETDSFGRVMTLDGKVMVTDKDEFVYHEMISHLSMCSHPNPRNVLIIGGGDCGTLSEVLRHESVEKAVLCEIDGDVIKYSREFFPKLTRGLDDGRSEVHVCDGVEFVKKSAAESYDVVIVDSTDPIGPGVGLFSESFYREVGRILRPDGITIAQCESPWDENIDIRKVYSNLLPVGKVYSAMGQMPGYPYGFWTWGIASKKYHPVLDQQKERSKFMQKTCRYYNSDLHAACFVLPNFFANKLINIISNTQA